MVYNLLNCNGWTTEASGFVASVGCMKARLAIVLLFFIIALMNKWGGEEIGISFSFVFALLLGLSSYFLMITLFGNLGWAMGAGVLGALLGGYGGGIFFGGEE